MSEQIQIRLTRAEAYPVGGDVEVRALLRARGLDTRTMTAKLAGDGSGDVVYSGEALKKVETEGLTKVDLEQAAEVAP